MKRLVAALAVLGATQAPLLAQPDAETFVASLRRAVANDDRPAVAALIRFPLTVWAGSIRLPISDAAAFAAQYDAVFTSDMKLIIASADVQRPSADLLMVGDAVEAQRVDGRFAITRISVLVAPRELTAGSTSPLATPAPAPGPARGATKPMGPLRLTFRSGQRSTQINGLVAAGTIDRFVLFVPRNQVLDVRVDRVRARDVVVRVLDDRTGKPVDARAGEGVRLWTGRIPAAADYRIEVMRTVPASEPAISYLLTISFK